MLSNTELKLYEETILCRTKSITNIGPALSIFSSGELICISYLNSSVLIRIDDCKIVQCDVPDFIKDQHTIFFGSYSDGSIQVTEKSIIAFGVNSMVFDEEVSDACCSDKIAAIASKNHIELYNLPSFEKISTYECETQVQLVAMANTLIGGLLINGKIIVLNPEGELINTVSVPDSYCISSMEILEIDNGYEFIIGTTLGELLHISNISEFRIELVGKGNVNLHKIGKECICSGEPPIEVFLNMDQMIYMDT